MANGHVRFQRQHFVCSFLAHDGVFVKIASFLHNHINDALSNII